MRRRRPTAIPTLAMVLVVALTVSLGFWQLRRAQERLDLQAQADAALAAAPVTVLATAMTRESVSGRRLTVRGHWLPGKAVYLDNRTHEGRAGFQLFAPLRIDGAADDDRVILVQRGWVPADRRDRGRLPELDWPAGVQVVSGLAILDLDQAMQLGDPAPVDERGRIWQQLSLADFRQWSKLTVQPFMLREASGPRDGIVRAWPVAGDRVAKHHGYALQWFVMALAAMLFWAWASFWRRGD